MDTKDFKDRNTLRSYFLKNKIPTEANFADLIKSTLNQIEDGICKPAGDPLSIIATGDAAGPQKLINFYGNLSDPNPSWTVQMNPRSDQNNPATAKAGFSISDGQGNSRVFVDKGTGSVGIGTNAPIPVARLNIQGGALAIVQTPTSLAKADAAIHVAGSAGGFDRLLQMSPILASKPGLNLLSSKNASGVDQWWAWGTTVDNKWRVHPGTDLNGTDGVTITNAGVGIGTITPAGQLDIANLVRVGLDEGGSGSKSISFGRDAGDDGNAGKVTYKGGFGDALHIVGSGTVPRRIKLWDNVEIAGTVLLGYESSNNDFSKAMPSGFYQASKGAGAIVDDVPDSSHDWTHLIAGRHSNTANNHQVQIASKYSANDRLFFRKIADGAPHPGWNEVATRGVNTFAGVQTIVANATTWGGWYEAIKFNQAAHSAITHPGGGLLFGLHSDRHFYFADTVAGKYVLTIDAPTGNTTIAGAVIAAHSDIYFTDAAHKHSGFGNTAGYAAIENAKDYDALMILGRAGTDKGRKVKLWDYLQVNGELEVTGNLGTHGFSAAPKKAGWGGGIHTWDVEAEGTIWSANGIDTKPHDVAENYYSEERLEAGDVVSTDGTPDGIKKTLNACDRRVLGVISTKPGFLLNAEHGEDEEHHGRTAYPLALCGRVPCKVTDENGPILPGDFLVSSSTSGYAMKAVGVSVQGVELHAPGTVIGKALEPFESGRGFIEVLVLLR